MHSTIRVTDGWGIDQPATLCVPVNRLGSSIISNPLNSFAQFESVSVLIPSGIIILVPHPRCWEHHVDQSMESTDDSYTN